jgi:hypothetical protein
MAHMAENRIMMLIDVLLREWVPLGNGVAQANCIALLPHQPTIYILTREGAIVYVGQTSDLKIRIAQHNHNARMINARWDTVHWFSPGVPDLSLRLQLETILICACLPERNRAVLLVKNGAGKLCEVKFGKKNKHNQVSIEVNRALQEAEEETCPNPST